MIVITILSAIMMVEIAVEQMLTQIGAQNVYVWRMAPQLYHILQALQPLAQLYHLLQGLQPLAQLYHLLQALQPLAQLTLLQYQQEPQQVLSKILSLLTTILLPANANSLVIALGYYH